MVEERKNTSQLRGRTNNPHVQYKCEAVCLQPHAVLQGQGQTQSHKSTTLKSPLNTHTRCRVELLCHKTTPTHTPRHTHAYTHRAGIHGQKSCDVIVWTRNWQSLTLATITHPSLYLPPSLHHSFPSLSVLPSFFLTLLSLILFSSISFT